MKKSFLMAATAAIVLSIGYANLSVLAQAPTGTRGVARPTATRPVARPTATRPVAHPTATRTASRPATPRSVARPVGPIALVDVSYIMKNHNRRKAEMAAMKADMDAATARVRSQSETIKKLTEQLQEFSPGSPDYKMREAEILKRKSDLQVQMKLQQNEFMQREAKILYTVYQEIKQEVNYYASTKNISMVMQFNGDQTNTDNPQAVIREINQSVVWYNQNADITPFILDALNGKRPANHTPPGPVGNTVPFNRK